MESRLYALIFLVRFALSVDARFLHSNEATVKATPAHQLDQLAPGDPYAVYDGKCMVKLSVCNQSALGSGSKALDGTDCEFLGDESELPVQSNGCGDVYVICSSGAAEKLAAEYKASTSNRDAAASFNGVAVAISSKDAGALFRSMGGTTHGWDASDVHGTSEFYSQYRNLDAIEKRVKEAVDSSGGLATLEDLSPKTHEGRAIKAVRIRDAHWKVGQPRVVLTFQIHAREWIAGMAGSYTVEHLIKALTQGLFDIKGMEVILVPIGNPDGFVYSSTVDRFWRKNRRRNKGCEMDPEEFYVCDGVDLNRNFQSPDIAHVWSPSLCCRQSYNGNSAQSEPESQALAKLIEEAPTSVHIDIHSFGQWVLAPYSYTLNAHREKTAIDKLGLAMRNAIEKVHGEKYTYGTGAEFGKGIAIGLFSDWSTQTGAYGFMFELRPKAWDFAPPADQILPTAEEAIQGIFTAIDWAKVNPPHNQAAS